MDRDEFIITVYCLVCEHYQVIKNTYPVAARRICPRPERRRSHHPGALRRVFQARPPTKTSLPTFAPITPISFRT